LSWNKEGLVSVRVYNGISVSLNIDNSSALAIVPSRLQRCRLSRNPTLHSGSSRPSLLSLKGTRGGESCVESEGSDLTRCADVFYRTNKDLDPVPRHGRKWGVTSFISYWISDAFKYETRDPIIKNNKFDSSSAPQHGNLPPASSQSVHLPIPTSSNTYLTTISRPDMARIPRHSRPRLLHDIFCHRFEWRNRCNPPCPLPRPRPRILGFLGLLHRNHLTRHPRHLLVRHPKHERRKRDARDDWRYLALIPHSTQQHTRESRHRDKHPCQFFLVLVCERAVSMHASEPVAVAVHGQEYHCADCVDWDIDLGVCVYGWRRRDV
jgi:hypothetical protein